MQKLSVIVITKNEARNIGDCLESVKWADEIVIIDDESTDNTLSIAKEYTNKIYIRKMLNGFGDQYRYGYTLTKGEWILKLDADERVTPELKQEIRSLLEEDKGFDAYIIRRKSDYFGRWIYHSRRYFPILRLGRKKRTWFDNKKVHGDMETDGKLTMLKGEILHYPYTSMHNYFSKMDHYTSLAATDFFEKGIRLKTYNYPWFFVIKPMLYFLKKYLYYQGFRDGFHGFMLCVFASIGMFMNYAKLWELQKRSNS